MRKTAVLSLVHTAPPGAVNTRPGARLNRISKARPALILCPVFLYPHTVTGVLSSSGRNVIRRNAAYLPAYSFMACGLIFAESFRKAGIGEIIPGFRWSDHGGL